MRQFVFVLLLSVALGCQCANDLTTNCSDTLPCPSGLTCVQSTCVALGADGGPVADGGTTLDAGQLARVTSLRIDPAMASLSSVNGSRPTQTFAAFWVLDDGTEAPASDALFSVDVETIGTVDQVGGLFTATGNVGGLVQVKAVSSPNGNTLQATAPVTVNLEWTSVAASLPADVATRFAQVPMVDPARQAQVVYPLDEVVFPQNVAPADVQWLTGDAADVFRLTFTKPNFTFVAYGVDDGKHHHLPDELAWRALAQTNPMVKAELKVDRWEAATQQVIAGTPVMMKFARAALVGSVYYWDIGAGRIVRIDDGTTNRANFMPTPPVDKGGTERCVGCHAVGPSGRYMVGRLGPGDNIGAVFDLTRDLSGDPPPTTFPTSPTSAQWWTASFNPDETRLVVSLDETNTSTMAFLDPMLGMSVNVANLPAGKVTHVSWSPDGKSIAYVDGANSWGGEFTQGDLSVVPVTAPDTLGAPVRVHTAASLAGATPPGSADSYPTWSPDSKKLAFANGTGCRSDAHQAALYWMNPDGTDVVRLDKASGGAAETRNFQPRFSPFQADGYYWMTFLSRRDYGNDQVGTRGASRQQIWVAAVKVGATPGQDPSEVGYWLPGQATTSQNIAAFWAPRACRKQTEACTVGSECCSGVCSTGSDGGLQCSPPPPDRCRLQGETCSSTGDCCPNKGLRCELNVCIPDIG